MPEHSWLFVDTAELSKAFVGNPFLPENYGSE